MHTWVRLHIAANNCMTLIQLCMTSCCERVVLTNPFLFMWLLRSFLKLTHDTNLVWPRSRVVGREKLEAATVKRGCMICRSARHTECVAYLLAHGADVYAQNSRGDNALHIAAKNGNAGALHALLSFRPHADGEDGSQLLGEIVVQGDAGPTRFIDLHNGRPSGRPACHLQPLLCRMYCVQYIVHCSSNLLHPFRGLKVMYAVPRLCFVTQ